MIIVCRNDFLFEIFTLLALSFPPSKYSCKSRLFDSQNGFSQQPIGINLNRTTLTKKNYHTVHYLFFIKTSDFGAEAERSYFIFLFWALKGNENLFLPRRIPVTVDEIIFNI